jgi:hypothetical protein
VVKYWDAIFYGRFEYLTVFDENLDWALLFFHEDDIYWEQIKNLNKKINLTKHYSSIN